MKQAAGLMEKDRVFFRCVWWGVLIAGLLVSVCAALFFWTPFAPTRSQAAARASSPKDSFISSPTSGPVGAVITVTGSNLTNFPGTMPPQPIQDGMSVQIGYITYQPILVPVCTPVTNGQVSSVQNHAFSGWFRWPASTGTGSFQVCALIGGNSNVFDAQGYAVVSDSAAQVKVAPTIPSAGKQVTVSGTNFVLGKSGFPADGATVNLFWRSLNGGSTLSLGTATSDESGAFTQTITVPAQAATGSYEIIASAGGGQPAVLSASTTFHVNGVTIAAVPTSTVQPSPTLTSSPTAAVTATVETQPGSQVSTSQNASGISPARSTGSSPILPVLLGGLLLTIMALVLGVLFVRRQRELAAAAASAASNGTASRFASSVGAGMAASGTTYGAGGLISQGPSAPNGAGAQPNISAMPFDPALAEAMRQAQVSMFITPRPPVNEKVPF